MQKNKYRAGDCPDNETLALMMQKEEKSASELLLLQNEAYITKLAMKYSAYCDIEDLEQEGAIALLEAAKKYDSSYGVKLLSYASAGIEAAMQDYLAMNSLALSVPPSRYNQLRKVAFICADEKSSTENIVLQRISAELTVSEKVARELLHEYKAFFSVWQLGDDVAYISYGGDPAKIYDNYMRRTLLRKAMREALNARQQNLIKYHLGIDQPNEQGMTFQELAVKLNYNSPSGAEKAYKGAIKKLKEHIHISEYGVWLRAQRMIREAKREVQNSYAWEKPVLW